MQHFFALDIGTTHCKAIIIDEDGNILHACKATITSVQQQEGQHEQDAEVIFQKVTELLKECILFSRENKIACVSFSAAMHSIMAVDKNGNPLTNAISWADTRSKKYAQALRNSKEGKAIYMHTGTPVHAMSPLCKLLWMKNEHSVIFVQAFKFISIKEYIFYRLFGKYIIDEGIASATGLYDIYNHSWYAPSLKLAGIDASKLSEVMPATHAETELTAAIKKQLNITSSVPFVLGGNDGCLANLGCGALSNNIAVLTIGTSGAVRLTIQPPVCEDAKGLFRYLLTNKIYVTGGPINNGGIALQWFAENFLQVSLLKTGSLNTVMELATQSPAGADHLFFLPYLLGERAPVWDEEARGVFYGLTIKHTKAHLTRAVIEGISFSLLQILEETGKESNNIHSVYVSGMVTQSSFWMQLLADMFGKKIILNDVTDASAMGAAFMGMHAVGFINDLTEVKKFLKADKVFVPDEEVHKIYLKQFEVYKKLYPALKNISI